MAIKLEPYPLELKEAQAFINENHRHHKAAHRDKFRVGVSHNGKLVGVAQVGRPVARMLDDGKTLEVLRLCTDGTPNACTFLYSRCARVAKELGYRKVITYILECEQGGSLMACGWHKEADCKGGSWSRADRPRENNGKYPECRKERWAVQWR